MQALYQTLATELRALIEQGVYRPGERLPGVRQLQRQRKVSVATVLAAYRQLEDSAHIEARPRSGFYVRARARLKVPEPAQSAPDPAPSPVTGQELVLRIVKAANNPHMVQLGTAIPPASYLPRQALQRATARAIRQHSKQLLGYEFPPGLPALRRQIARRMAAAGAAVNPEEVIITNGCQEAVSLALRVITQPGDVVAVESPTFYGLLQIIEALGLKALEIPTHPRDGMALDALQFALEQWPVKACVSVPNFSNPLGYCMSDSNKAKLLTLLAQYGIPLIQDDVYGELGFAPQHPGIMQAANSQHDVIYCSSFSKSLAPGLRLGWIVPGRHREQVEYFKYISNLATPGITQFAISEFLQNGGFDRYLRQVKPRYAIAVQRMIDWVERYFPPGTKVTQPQGGFVIWVELANHIDSFQLTQRLLEDGISIAPGSIFSATQKYHNFIRLSCVCEQEDRIEESLIRIASYLA